MAYVGVQKADEQFTKKLETDRSQLADKLGQEQGRFLTTLRNADELQQKTRAKEFRLKYYERQMAFLDDFCQTAARIAEAVKLADVQGDIQAFQRHGRFSVVLFGDCALRGQALEFVRTLDGINLNAPLSNENRRILSHLSYNMTRTSRAILGKTFSLDEQDPPCFDEAPMRPPTAEPPFKVMPDPAIPREVPRVMPRPNGR